VAALALVLAGGSGHRIGRVAGDGVAPGWRDAFWFPEGVACRVMPSLGNAGCPGSKLSLCSMRFSSNTRTKCAYRRRLLMFYVAAHFAECGALAPQTLLIWRWRAN
jgi:hypothetical protein